MHFNQKELLNGETSVMMKGIYSQKNLLEVDESGTAEHDLWVSVLCKAAHDAIFCTDLRESRIAISWFKTGGFNFRTVCGYAGREPEYVHRVMELPIKRREKELQQKYGLNNSI